MERNATVYEMEYFLEKVRPIFYRLCRSIGNEEILNSLVTVQCGFKQTNQKTVVKQYHLLMTSGKGRRIYGT